MFKPQDIRQDFPVLDKDIIYFDNACMSLKPVQVIQKIKEYYQEYTACAGRSAHQLASMVDEEVEKARRAVRELIHAKQSEEIIFTRNTTEGLNLVAHSFGLEKEDEVVITDKEHNSNLIPWLKLQKKLGIKVRVAVSNPDNTFNLDNFSELLGENTRLVSMVHTSNLDGVTNPVREIAKLAHEEGAKVMIDGAQSAPGHPIDVRELDVDFFSFSGHKMIGPTGMGALYGKKEELMAMDQFLVGGETVIDSSLEDYKQEALPMRFEAGLQDYAGILGFGKACLYLKKIGMESIHKHEIKLNKMISESLMDEERIQILGPEDPEQRGGIFSFNVKGMDPHHISKMLDVSKNILTRSGAHCVHSWFNKHGISGSARASLYLYNTQGEAEIFIDELKKILTF